MKTKSVQSELRAQHRSAFRKHELALDHGQSRQMIINGNQEGHQSLLKRHHKSPEERYEVIQKGEADYVHINCSDSRAAVPDHESDSHVGMQTRVAGNVITAEGASFDETREVINLVKPGGIVLLTSHTKCGAVKAHAGWENQGRPDAGNEELTTLLNTVEKDNPHGNLVVQAGRATMLLDGQILITGHYDWDAMESVEFFNHGSVRAANLLKGGMRQYHKDHEGLFSDLTAGQRPHTIAVAYHKLPYSTNTIFNAQPGEVFTTTGSEGGMDACDKASLLYAAEHCGTNHIAMVAPNIRGVEAMFTKWEQDIRAMVVGGKRQFDEALNSGQMAITKFVYNLSNGKLES